VAPPLGEAELEIRYPLGAAIPPPESHVIERRIDVMEAECSSAVV
jgi:hypothetical protein